MNEITDKDLYEILHIKKNATETEIKSAYRQLVRIHHPDIDETKDNIENFKQIRYAYDILSNPDKKRLYDLKHGFNKELYNQEKEKDTLSESREETFDKTTETKSRSFSKLLNDIIEGIFIYVRKVTDKNQNKNSINSDIYANVTISAKEAMFGTSRIINVVQTALCPNCSGKRFINESLCSLCKGTGDISTHKRINAKIPPNTKNNDKIKLEGLGNKNTSDTEVGDLYLIINIDEKSLFTVKDNIVYMDLPISAFEAALGANILIPTFYNDITIKIPPNTSSGQRFRLKGQGLYDKENGVKGDMIVNVFIKMPKKLSTKEIELYKELMENNTYDVREGLRDNE